MSEGRKLEAAADRLDELIAETVRDGKVGRDLTYVALRMVVPARDLLRHDLALLRSCTTDEQRERVESAAVQAGDVALAVAILGGS